MLKTIKTIFAAGVVLSAASMAPVAAQQAGAGANMGSLTEFLPGYVEEGVWRKGIVDGAFRVENSTDGNASTWYSAPLRESEAGRRVVSLDVRIQEGDPDLSHAGLLYGYVEGRDLRYFFTIETGKVSLFEIGGGAANAMMVTETDAGVDGWNTLKIVEEGRMVTLEVNGHNIGGIGNDSMGQGAVGIVAWGTGSFEFRNFETSVN